jgi:hypothetical protein
MHLECQEQSLGIDQQVAFATVDLLAAIIAALATDSGGFDRLRVDNRSTRLHLAPHAQSQRFTQHGVDRLPQATQARGAQIVIDGFPMRQIVRQQFPATAALGNVEHGVEQLPARDSSWSTIGLGFRHQRGDQFPLAVN